MAAAAHGYIVNDCTPDRIRLAPPLVLTEAQADDFLAAWPTILEDARTPSADPEEGGT